MRARLMIATVGLAVALLPISASASDSGMTVTTANSMQLTDRVLVSVPVSVVCTDIAGLTPFFDRITVNVNQAFGTSISHGSATISAVFGFGTTSTPLFTCNGTTVNQFVIPVLADTSGTPFHGGPAIVTADTVREEGTSCGPGCFTNLQSIAGSTGPISVRLS